MWELTTKGKPQASERPHLLALPAPHLQQNLARKILRLAGRSSRIIFGRSQRVESSNLPHTASTCRPAAPQKRPQQPGLNTRRHRCEDGSPTEIFTEIECFQINHHCLEGLRDYGALHTRAVSTCWVERTSDKLPLMLAERTLRKKLINPATPEEPFCGLRMTKDCSVRQRATIFHLLIFGVACYANCAPYPIEKSPSEVFLFC
jgi:hypothetical protein